MFGIGFCVGAGVGLLLGVILVFGISAFIFAGDEMMDWPDEVPNDEK